MQKSELSSKPEYQNAKLQNHKANRVVKSESRIKNQESELQAKQTRARQESLLLPKGCCVQYLNKLAYK